MKNVLKNLINKKNIHLDFAATTYVDALVSKKIKPYFKGAFFNPSSSYLDGQSIKKEIVQNRNSIARFFQVKENEVIFTQGGTESANLALLGFAKSILRQVDFTPHMIFSNLEHPAVSECISVLKEMGIVIDTLCVNESGIVDIKELEKLLKKETVLVGIIFVSSELGVIQPFSKITRTLKRFKNEMHRSFSEYPYLYTDASQAILTQNISLSGLGIDMMTVDGSKIYAPKMTGMLIKKQYVEIEPIMYGGGQEYGIRPGTENPATSKALSIACEIISKRQSDDVYHFQRLKTYFIKQLDISTIPYSINSEISLCVPNILNICIEGLNSDFAVIQMDELGVNCASATACASNKGIPISQSVIALGKKGCETSSLRFSFGRTTTTRQIKKAVKILMKVCQKQKIV